MAVAVHPTPEALAAFARGELPPDELAAVAKHVSRRPVCHTQQGGPRLPGRAAWAWLSFLRACFAAVTPTCTRGGGRRGRRSGPEPGAQPG
jgi:hypothetical protein